MNDDARSRITAARASAARRSSLISGLVLVLPLVLGARGCERAQDDDACDGGACGESGRGGQGGGAAGDSSSAGRGGSAGSGGSGGNEGCLYDGERHDGGDSFPSDDGCNTCSCTAGGMVACTRRACTNPCGGGECDGGSAGRAGSPGQAGSDGSAGAGSGGTGNAGSSSSGGGAGTGTGSGQTCGGIASLECGDPDEFCNYEPAAGGQGCDGTISDAGGVCRTRPPGCTKEPAPICGCDRHSYENDCVAHIGGISALHDGYCTEVDCAEIGGHAVDGFGPAPVCPSGEVEHGPIVYSNGMIAIEGTICCVPQ